MYYVEVRDEHDNLSVVLSAERIEIIANGGEPMRFPAPTSAEIEIVSGRKTNSRG